MIELVKVSDLLLYIQYYDEVLEPGIVQLVEEPQEVPIDLVHQRHVIQDHYYTGVQLQALILHLLLFLINDVEAIKDEFLKERHYIIFRFTVKSQGLIKIIDSFEIKLFAFLFQFFYVWVIYIMNVEEITNKGYLIANQ